MPESAAPDAGFGRRSILPLPPGPLVGFVVAVLAVLLIAYFTDQALEARQAAGQDVTHTMQVLERAQQLLTTVADAETGQRGFVLTNEDKYLEPYTKARESLQVQMQELRDLTADNAEQRGRLDELRAERDQRAVDATLGGLVEAAAGEENAMPAIIAAVEAEATLGEICGALRQVFGDYRPTVAAQI